MLPQEIYNTLLEEANSAFMESSIIKKQQNWGLSVCATPIQIGKPIILGINWGGGDSEDQKEMPSKDFFKKDYDNKCDYTFLKKSQKLIEEFLKIDVEKAEFNYTNLCFFRSPKSSDLIYNDYKVCLPTIEKLVNYIKPPWILSLGNSNMAVLKPKLNELKTFKTAGTSHPGYSGILWGYNFYCFPHPNARKLSNDTRYEIWKTVFPGKY